MVLARRVDCRQFKSRIAGDRKLYHCNPVLKAGDRRIVFQRLVPDGREEHSIQAQLVRRCLSDGEVAAMGRVKGATEESKAHQDDRKLFVRQSLTMTTAKTH